MKTFITSDTHFGDSKLYKPNNGIIVRPWAKSASEGDEIIIEKWNQTVSNAGTVYHLGDVAVSSESLDLLRQCNGRKILIKGNHDTLPIQQYLRYFDDVLAVDRISGFVLSHVPIHPACLPKWCIANVHGHLHQHMVLTQDNITDDRYYNVCLEVNNGFPVNLDFIKIFYGQEL